MIVWTCLPESLFDSTAVFISAPCRQISASTESNWNKKIKKIYSHTNCPDVRLSVERRPRAAVNAGSRSVENTDITSSFVDRQLFRERDENGSSTFCQLPADAAIGVMLWMRSRNCALPHGVNLKFQFSLESGNLRGSCPACVRPLARRNPNYPGNTHTAVRVYVEPLKRVYLRAARHVQSHTAMCASGLKGRQG